VLLHELQHQPLGRRSLGDAVLDHLLDEQLVVRRNYQGRALKNVVIASEAGVRPFGERRR
jgi:hypothetical protein